MRARAGRAGGGLRSLPGRHEAARGALRAILQLSAGIVLCAAGCRGSSGAGAPDAGAGGPDGGAACDPIVRSANLGCQDPEVAAALALLKSMTLEERVQQMSGPPSGSTSLSTQEDNGRLGVPGMKYVDGPRGVHWYPTDYGTTVFPVTALRASSWDPELERLIGKAIAREVRDFGYHVVLAPTLNQVMHPRGGRSQESYGEDTFLLGVMGRAFVAGVQHDPKIADPAEPDQPPEDSYRVQSCVKHFAANNIENTRIFVNAVLDERTLREVYLGHFKRVVDGGVSCVMSSYNRLNGSYNGASKSLLRDLLKTEWRYPGYVISDWFAKGSTIESATAGLDVEMPFSSGTFPAEFDSSFYYGPKLVAAVQGSQLAPELVDEAVLRVLYAKIHSGLLSHAQVPHPFQTKSEAAQALALRAAREGLVLLKNGPTAALGDDVLPLSKSKVRSVAVVGRYARSENLGDHGGSDARVLDGELVITPFEGIAAALAATGGVATAYAQVEGNEAAIGAAEALVVVAAYAPADLGHSSGGEEGEGTDRVSLRLPARDLANIAAAVALKATHPALKIVVVMKSGGAIAVADWVDGVDALIMAWFGGMKEGTALAEVLFGDVNPSGHLVQSFPVRESDLPAFRNDTTGDVQYGYYHGYRWLEKQGIAAQYPFGFGLSYTTFAHSKLKVAQPSITEAETLKATLEVTNSGPVMGTEVVQLYVGYSNTAVKDRWGRPAKELKSFARVSDLLPGETRTIELTVEPADLAYWDVAAHAMMIEKMEYQLFVAPSSDPAGANLQKASFTIR